MPKGGKRESAGRPKGSRNKLTATANATLTELAQAYTDEMLRILVDLARNAESEGVRATCAFGLLDRGHGKPKEHIEADVHVTSLPELVALSYRVKKE
jgi:hypothetical protein